MIHVRWSSQTKMLMMLLLLVVVVMVVVVVVFVCVPGKFTPTIKISIF